MLTNEQQEIITNSIWVVNTALKRQNLSYNEDLRQDAILYMCKCLDRFDSSKGVKWETYAYKNVFMYIQRVNKKEHIVTEHMILTDKPIIDLDKQQQIVDAKDKANQLKRIVSYCNDKEKQLLKLKYMGFTIKEIAERMGTSEAIVKKVFWEIKMKIQGEREYE